MRPPTIKTVTTQPVSAAVHQQIHQFQPAILHTTATNNTKTLNPQPSPVPTLETSSEGGDDITTNYVNGRLLERHSLINQGLNKKDKTVPNTPDVTANTVALGRTSSSNLTIDAITLDKNNSKDSFKPKIFIENSKSNVKTNNKTLNELNSIKLKHGENCGSDKNTSDKKCFLKYNNNCDNYNIFKNNIDNHNKFHHLHCHQTTTDLLSQANQKTVNVYENGLNSQKDKENKNLNNPNTSNDKNFEITKDYYTPSKNEHHLIVKRSEADESIITQLLHKSSPSLGIFNKLNDTLYSDNKRYLRKSETSIIYNAATDTTSTIGPLTASSSNQKFDKQLSILPSVHKRVKSNDNSGKANNRRSLQLPLNSGSPVDLNYIANKANLRHSWYATRYNILEEDIELEKKDNTRVLNLADTKQHLTSATNESATFLEQRQEQPQPELNNHQAIITTVTAGNNQGKNNSSVTRSKRSAGGAGGIPITNNVGPPAVTSLGGPAPRKRRFEQFLKSLVGRRPSKEPITPLLSSPEIKVTHSPSIENFDTDTNLSAISNENHHRIKNSASTTSLNSVHQKLWSVVPLLKKDVSCTSLALPAKSTSLTPCGLNHSKSHCSSNQHGNNLCEHNHQHTSCSNDGAGLKECCTGDNGNLRKCETVLALTQSTYNLEPIKPLNRLRNCASVATCSRCSSLLSLAAGNGSRYSLNLSNGGFVSVNNSSNNAKYNSNTSINNNKSNIDVVHNDNNNEVELRQKLLFNSNHNINNKLTCKLCLGEYKSDNFTRIQQCGCSFCSECMTAYIEFEIMEGAYEVSCPDAMCPTQGIISIDEISKLAATHLVDKHHRYRLNREVELDKFRTWCPKAGCETICTVLSVDKTVTLQPSSSLFLAPCAVHCPTCSEDFCSGCKKGWHPAISCEENTRQLRRLGDESETAGLGLPFDNDLIKYCPMCVVPIEKDEGCAQMMCKRCKHVFCWYCLASLDDDFLLRHYDKGPCKNKLGHSRASVVWHRAQVIGIFAGFGILLLVASPLLLLAAPCIVCCKCRICSGATKLEENDAEYEEVLALNR